MNTVFPPKGTTAFIGENTEYCVDRNHTIHVCFQIFGKCRLWNS